MLHMQVVRFSSSICNRFDKLNRDLFCCCTTEAKTTVHLVNLEFGTPKIGVVLLL